MHGRLSTHLRLWPSRPFPAGSVAQIYSGIATGNGPRNYGEWIPSDRDDVDVGGLTPEQVLDMSLPPNGGFTDIKIPDGNEGW